MFKQGLKENLLHLKPININFKKISLTTRIFKQKTIIKLILFSKIIKI